MKLSLDTHILLWWLDDPALVSQDARDAISDPANDVFISAVVAWEIAIKRSLGKLAAPADLESAVLSCRFLPMNVTIAHALAIETLPPHHRDPFDRMLIAQAQMENCTIVSRDPIVAQYGVATILG